MAQEDEGKRAFSFRKQAHLVEWMRRNPYATKEKARNELIRVFGESISTPALNAIIRRTRDEASARAQKRNYITIDPENLGSDPTQTRLHELIREMRAQGLIKIELHEDGQISCETEAATSKD